MTWNGNSLPYVVSSKVILILCPAQIAKIDLTIYQYLVIAIFYGRKWQTSMRDNWR